MIGFSLSTLKPEPSQLFRIIVVSSVQENSEAAHDGAILPGDKLLAINGQTAREMTMDEIYTLLGPCDEEVKLDVARSDAMPFVCRLRCESARLVSIDAIATSTTSS